MRTYSHMDELWLDAVSDVIDQENVYASRVGKCYEILGWSGSFMDTQNTWLCNQRRALSPTYAAAEILWIMGRHTDASMIKKYAPQYKKFAEPDGSVHGAYGARLAMNTTEGDILEQAIKVLNSDPATRRCVVSLWHPMDIFDQNKQDLPCTIYWSFMIRQEKLHMFAHMRSQDVWLGLPYDIFCFTCVQRMIAGELGLETGTYTHSVDSLHLYEKNYQAALEAMTCMNQLPWLSHTWNVQDDTRDMFLATEYERKLRDKSNMSDELPVGSMSRDLCAAIDPHYGIASNFTSLALQQGMKTYANRRRN